MEEAELIHATSSYAHLRFRNEHETKVSLRDIAPMADRDLLVEESDHVSKDFDENESSIADEVAPASPNPQSSSESSITSKPHENQAHVGSPRPSTDTQNSGEFSLPCEHENDFWNGPIIPSDT